MADIAKIDKPQKMAVAGDESALLSVIERMASNPDADIDKFERLMRMHERNIERQAQVAYARDLSQMQDELPAIKERGQVIAHGQVRYSFAKWEDINEVIKPILKRYGFALSFRIDCGEGVKVTGVLSHQGGHSEETTITLPADASGNKNAVQAVASSVSYGKRYTSGALLNLTSHGEDDDAYAAVQELDLTDWFSAVAECASVPDLKKRKAEMVAEFGAPQKIPKRLVTAYNEKFTELQGNDHAAS